MGLRNMLCRTPGASRGKRRCPPPQDSGAGWGVTTSHRRNFSRPRELFWVRGLGLCLLPVVPLQKRLLKFIRCSLVTGGWKKNQLCS